MGVQLSAPEPLAAIVQPAGDGVIVTVHVQPRAGTTAIAGRHGDALRVRVAAPAVEGRATEAARQVLAAALGVPPRAVHLVAGERSRHKRFRVDAVDARAAAARLAAALAGESRPE